MKKAVIYARSAYGEQDLAEQLQRLRDSLGPETEVASFFTDRGQSSTPDRPGLRQALDYLEQHHADNLVVQSADRLARTTIELSDLQTLLQDRGLELEMVSGQPSLD